MRLKWSHGKYVCMGGMQQRARAVSMCACGGGEGVGVLGMMEEWKERLLSFGSTCSSLSR